MKNQRKIMVLGLVTLLLLSGLVSLGQAATITGVSNKDVSDKNNEKETIKETPSVTTSISSSTAPSPSSSVSATPKSVITVKDPVHTETDGQRNQTGNYVVFSEPSFASIYLDGTYCGETPKFLPDISVGTHTVTLYKEGYQSWSKTEYLHVNQTIYYNITLVPIIPTGNYYISCDPSDARIYLDWVYKGPSPQNITDVPVGNHTVMIMKGGYQTWIKTEYLSAGQMIIYDVILEPNQVLDLSAPDQVWENSWFMVRVTSSGEPVPNASVYWEGDYNQTFTTNENGTVLVQAPDISDNETNDTYAFLGAWKDGYVADWKLILIKKTILGDVNGDSFVNWRDIDPFVSALLGEEYFSGACPQGNFWAADCNGDGAVNFADIDPFVAILSG